MARKKKTPADADSVGQVEKIVPSQLHLDFGHIGVPVAGITSSSNASGEKLLPGAIKPDFCYYCAMIYVNHIPPPLTGRQHDK